MIGRREDTHGPPRPPATAAHPGRRYYRGKGGRHVLRLGPFPGKAQPMPPVGPERLRECRWEPCHTLEVPRDWVSGVYLGKLSSTKHRYQSYLIFIVRDDRPADL